jgi:hypothetical protein
MKSRGLGDSIEKFTKATGIKTMVNTISKGLNVPCGCEARKGALNKIFPYESKNRIKHCRANIWPFSKE